MWECLKGGWRVAEKVQVWEAHLLQNLPTGCQFPARALPGPQLPLDPSSELPPLVLLLCSSRYDQTLFHKKKKTNPKKQKPILVSVSPKREIRERCSSKNVHGLIGARNREGLSSEMTGRADGEERCGSDPVATRGAEEQGAGGAHRHGCFK